MISYGGVSGNFTSDFPIKLGFLGGKDHNLSLSLNTFDGLFFLTTQNTSLLLNANLGYFYIFYDEVLTIGGSTNIVNLIKYKKLKIIFC